MQSPSDLCNAVTLPYLHTPGLNSLAPGLKEKLLAKGLSFEDAEVAELGVGGCPAAAAPLSPGVLEFAACVDAIKLVAEPQYLGAATG